MGTATAIMLSRVDSEHVIRGVLASADEPSGVTDSAELAGRRHGGRCAAPASRVSRTPTPRVRGAWEKGRVVCRASYVLVGGCSLSRLVLAEMIGEGKIEETRVFQASTSGCDPRGTFGPTGGV